jgi:hypothetical protein
MQRADDVLDRLWRLAGAAQSSDETSDVVVADAIDRSVAEAGQEMDPEMGLDRLDMRL